MKTTLTASATLTLPEMISERRAVAVDAVKAVRAVDAAASLLDEEQRKHVSLTVAPADDQNRISSFKVEHVAEALPAAIIVIEAAPPSADLTVATEELCRVLAEPLTGTGALSLVTAAAACWPQSAPESAADYLAGATFVADEDVSELIGVERTDVSPLILGLALVRSVRTRTFRPTADEIAADVAVVQERVRKAIAELYVRIEFLQKVGDVVEDFADLGTFRRVFKLPDDGTDDTIPDTEAPQ